MIVSKREPRVQSLNYPAIFDDLYQRCRDVGLSERDSQLNAMARCSALWLQANPFPADIMPVVPRDCCWCGDRGGTEPVPVLGSSALAHHLCKPPLFEFLAEHARFGLAAEGLRLGASDGSSE